MGLPSNASPPRRPESETSERPRSVARRDATRRAPRYAGMLRLLALALSAATARAACKAVTLDFL